MKHSNVFIIIIVICFLLQGCSSTAKKYLHPNIGNIKNPTSWIKKHPEGTFRLAYLKDKLPKELIDSSKMKELLDTMSSLSPEWKDISNDFAKLPNGWYFSPGAGHGLVFFFGNTGFAFAPSSEFNPSGLSDTFLETELLPHNVTLDINSNDNYWVRNLDSANISYRLIRVYGKQYMLFETWEDEYNIMKSEIDYVAKLMLKYAKYNDE